MLHACPNCHVIIVLLTRHVLFWNRIRTSGEVKDDMHITGSEVGLCKLRCPISGINKSKRRSEDCIILESGWCFLSNDDRVYNYSKQFWVLLDK